jgi:hypothetical protein
LSSPPARSSKKRCTVRSSLISLQVPLATSEFQENEPKKTLNFSRIESPSSSKKNKR